MIPDIQKCKIPAPTNAGGSSGFCPLNPACSGGHSGILGQVLFPASRSVIRWCLGISRGERVFITKSGKH